MSSYEPFTPDEVVAVRELARQGMSVSAIVARENMTFPDVRDILRRWPINRRLDAAHGPKGGT
jgi:hypothetical protein